MSRLIAAIALAGLTALLAGCAVVEAGGAGDGPTDSNYLDCGAGTLNGGRDLGAAGYRANCQF